MAGMVPSLGNGAAMSDETTSAASIVLECLHEPVTYPFTMPLLTAERTCVCKLSCVLRRSNTEACKQIHLRIVSMGLNITTAAAGCLLLR